MNSIKIVGHAPTRSRFMSAMQHGRLHHAWLFTGAEGIGKASLAMEFAHHYLCEKNRGGSAHEACFQCHGCKMLKANSHPDFLRVERELDKSGKKRKRDVNIEQVRSVLSFLNLSGSESARRVVLLEEGEKLNHQAANALLKGLEEPTAGSLLLLVCNDPMRLPATIRSRCMLATLSPLNDMDTEHVLKKMGLQTDVLALAATLAHGQPGRMQCLQDEKIANALLSWKKTVSELTRTDISALDAWLTSYAKEIPHQLIVDVVITSCKEQFAKPMPFALHEPLMVAAMALASLPKQIARQTLRAAPALFAAILQLRTNLLAVKKNA
ncbi:MAG: DNA polymerase III subunit delta' [Mariprofundaceae bacterium]